MDFMAPASQAPPTTFNSNAYARRFSQSAEFVAPKRASPVAPPVTTMQVIRNIRENNPGYLLAPADAKDPPDTTFAGCPAFAPQ